MAILKLGPLVADVRGPIGATVFKRSRAGLVMQRRTGARALGSTAQNTIRATVSRLAYTWRTMTPAQRLLWQRYAAAAAAYMPGPRNAWLSNPYTLFIDYNTAAAALGVATGTAPPTKVGRHPASKSNMGMVGYTQFAVGFAVDPLLAGQWALVYASRPFPKSQTNPHVWTWKAYLTVGPKSIDVFYPLPRAISTAAYINVTISRHSPTYLDAPPRTTRLSYPP